MTGNGKAKGGPPDFAEARNLRQKARAAGLAPNHWYAVEWEKNLPAGKVREVVFWNTSIAVFRGRDGRVRAIANRCAHRQLKLTLGQVEGCELVCSYHGWTYDGDGKVVRISHDLFGRAFPKLKVPSYPVRLRYGLVWIFPGDAARAENTPMPEIPELEGEDAWARVALDFTWAAHHSMIVDNVSDFTHAHLHRKYRPFSDARLLRHALKDDRVELAYETKVGRGRISGLFVDHARLETNHMELCYQYPYQWSDTDGEIKHWLFLLPISERRTRAFFVFYFKALKVPFLPVALRGGTLQRILDVSKHGLIRPLLAQDGVAVEAEQEGYEQYWNTQFAELNPVVRAFQELTVRKWEEHLAAAPSRPSRTREGGSADALSGRA